MMYNSSSHDMKIWCAVFLKNFPLTIDDVATGDKIFGPIVASLKGKTERKAIDQVENIT